MAAVISQTTGLDKSLKLLQYTLQLLSTLRPPSPNSVTPNVNGEGGNLNELVKLTRPIGEARVMMRLFDLPVYSVPWSIHSSISLFYKLRTLFRNRRQSSKEGISKEDVLNVADVKEWMCASSLLVYYVAELMYILGSYNVSLSLRPSFLTSSSNSPSSAVAVRKGVDTWWWSRVSCRGWLAWLLLDVHSLVSQIHSLPASSVSDSSASSPSAKSSNNSNREIVWQLTERRRLYMKLLARLCDLLLAYQWSVIKGPLSGRTVNLCGFLSALMDFSVYLHSLNGKQ